MKTTETCRKMFENMLDWRDSQRRYYHRNLVFAGKHHKCTQSAPLRGAFPFGCILRRARQHNNSLYINDVPHSYIKKMRRGAKVKKCAKLCKHHCQEQPLSGTERTRLTMLQNPLPGGECTHPPAVSGCKLLGRAPPQHREAHAKA